jgi:replicative DNA helicase
MTLHEQRPDRGKVGASKSGGEGQQDNASLPTDPHTPPEAFEHRRLTADLAEVALLGSMMLRDDARAEAVRVLAGDDFGREAHRTLFEVIAELHQAGGPVDPVCVAIALADTNRLEVVGGPATVHEVAGLDGCPSPSSWPSYLTVVQREGRRRRGIAVLRRAIERLERGEDPAAVAADLKVPA